MLSIDIYVLNDKKDQLLDIQNQLKVGKQKIVILVSSPYFKKLVNPNFLKTLKNDLFCTCAERLIEW